MNDTAIAIREAGVADAAALAPLYAQLGYPTPVQEIARRLREHGRGVIFVAQRGEGLAGFAAVSCNVHFVSGEYADLEGLVVAETERSGGIGARLLAAAESWARDRGAATLIVRSNVVRERAHRFYERYGYERVKSQHLFRKELA